MGPIFLTIVQKTGPIYENLYNSTEKMHMSRMKKEQRGHWWFRYVPSWKIIFISHSGGIADDKSIC